MSTVGAAKPNSSATLQRSITRVLQKIQQRHGTIVMAYIADIVIITRHIPVPNQQDPAGSIFVQSECGIVHESLRLSHSTSSDRTIY